PDSSEPSTSEHSSSAHGSSAHGSSEPDSSEPESVQDDSAPPGSLRSEAEPRVTGLLDVLSVSAVVLDTDGRIVFWTPQAE
ncbi:PAS sensor protein, partial [Xylella fastidiosa subsp. multiplex]|nr:PAS sensor protein [Xylella fastidiosa subsp. multiplex]